MGLEVRVAELREKCIDAGFRHGKRVTHNVYSDGEAKSASDNATVVLGGTGTFIILVDERKDVAVARGMWLWEAFFWVFGATGGQDVGHPGFHSKIDGIDIDGPAGDNGGRYHAEGAEPGREAQHRHDVGADEFDFDSVENQILPEANGQGDFHAGALEGKEGLVVDEVVDIFDLELGGQDVRQ